MSKFNYWQKFEENGYYHIYNRVINRTYDQPTMINKEEVFLKFDSNREKALDSFVQYHQKFKVEMEMVRE